MHTLGLELDFLSYIYFRISRNEEICVPQAKHKRNVMHWRHTIAPSHRQRNTLVCLLWSRQRNCRRQQQQTLVAVWQTNRRNKQKKNKNSAKWQFYAGAYSRVAPTAAATCKSYEYNYSSYHHSHLFHNKHTQSQHSARESFTCEQRSIWQFRPLAQLLPICDVWVWLRVYNIDNVEVWRIHKWHNKHTRKQTETTSQTGRHSHCARTHRTVKRRRTLRCLLCSALLRVCLYSIILFATRADMRYTHKHT